MQDDDVAAGVTRDLGGDVAAERSVAGLGPEDDRRRRQFGRALEYASGDVDVGTDAVQQLAGHGDPGLPQLCGAGLQQLVRVSGGLEVDGVLADQQIALDDVQEVYARRAGAGERNGHGTYLERAGPTDGNHQRAPVTPGGARIAWPNKRLADLGRSHSR